MAAAPGNQYAARARVWRDAINKALEKRSRVSAKEALEELAEKLLNAAENGEAWALKEIGDRLDGRPAQSIGGDDELPPITVKGAIELVRPD